MVNAAKLRLGEADHRRHPLVRLRPRRTRSRRPASRSPPRLVADLLAGAGADRVLTMDLHAGQVQGFFDVPVDHMTALPHVRAALPRPGPDARDAGHRLRRRRPRQARQEVRREAGRRPRHHQQAAPGPQRGRDHPRHRRRERQVAIIIDDIIDTAGTLCAGAEAVMKRGATRVFACATHPVFSGPALGRIEDSVLEQVVVCDTIPVDPCRGPGQGRGAVRRPDPGRDDRQRLPRRLGLGHLRGREPALLARPPGGPREGRHAASASSAIMAGDSRPTPTIRQPPRRDRSRSIGFVKAFLPDRHVRPRSRRRAGG